MKVTIIGAGNVATVLGNTIIKAGHQIMQVFARNAGAGKKLAEQLKAGYTGNLLELSKETDLFIIAVTDQNIVSVVNELPMLDGIVAHTAGSVSKDLFKGVARRFGVIYPLQSLSREADILPAIPVLIDGNTEEVQQALASFARSWSPHVAFTNDEQRLSTHIAAVMVNNFTNHLVALTEEFCNKEGVDFKILLPLIQQTVGNLGALPAARLQTGPAVRGDIAVIEKHLQLLNRYPPLRNLYLKITESIIVHNRKHTMTY